MKKNMSFTDRTVRTLLAIVFFILYATGVVPGIAGIILMVVSIIFILTSFVGFCPLYAPFGFRTLKTKTE